MITSTAPASRWLQMLAAGAIVLAGVAAYYNSFGGVFAYDDQGAIVENPTIRHLWPIWPVLVPPHSGETVSGRPLLNVSLAINYAVSGLEVWSYHAANLLIHIGATLLLFGILRRTFLMPALRDRLGKAAAPLALASALIWMVHPLQTESITYIVQRAESLAGLCYLLTLYCVIRGAGTVLEEGRETRGLRRAQSSREGRGTRGQARIQPTAMGGNKGDYPPSPAQIGELSGPPAESFVPRPSSLVPRPSSLAPRLWYAAAVLACLLGATCKEILSTAPLVVLLYDRTFLAGSFVGAWRRRWGLYLGLIATWGLLAYLVFSTGLIARQAELGAPDPWSYARTQPQVILHYLRLSVWPSRLCMSYDWPVADTLWQILPGAVAVAALLAATLWGVIRRRPWGFLGAWFFLILAPTSSVMPLNQLAHAHRMYLPLAAAAVLAVAGAYAFWQRWLPRPARSGYRGAVVGWAAPVIAWACVLIGLTSATVIRNSVYRSSLAIWQDGVDKNPHNAMAHNNLGIAFAELGETERAVQHYQEALRLKANYPDAHNNLAMALASLGKTDEAIRHYHEALRLAPDLAVAHYNLGNVLVRTEKTDEAIEHYQQALRLKPGYAKAHLNLGAALARLGKTDQAIEHYQAALRLKPDLAEVYNNWGLAVAGQSRIPQAIEHYEAALRLKLDYPEAHNNLAASLARLGRTDEAIEHYQQAVRLQPDYAAARHNLARILARVGRINEAIEQYRQFLQLVPDSVEALNGLAWLLATHEPAEGGNAARAVELAQRARELGRQENPRCLDTLAAAYAAAGRFPDAVAVAQMALQLAEATGQTALAKRIRSRLELYRAGQPYRDAPGSSKP